MISKSPAVRRLGFSEGNHENPPRARYPGTACLERRCTAADPARALIRGLGDDVVGAGSVGRELPDLEGAAGGLRDPLTAD